jgi:tetratricopeptide (TPR) repeat protein
VLTPLARHDEAIAEMKRALKWDPYAPILHTNLGVSLYYARRFDEAISQLRKVIEMDPQFNIPYWTLGQAWAVKGRLPEAVDALQTARRLAPGPKPELSLAYCYAACGKPVEARAVRDAALSKYSRPAYSTYELAWVNAALGEPEAAIRELETARADKEPQLIQAGPDPKFDGIRDTVGYKSVLRTIGLNPAVYHQARPAGITR